MSDDFSAKFKNEPRLGEGGQYKKELVEELTSMWNSSSSDKDVPVYNKKLHVRHVVASEASASSSKGTPTTSNSSNTNNSNKNLPSSFQQGADKRNNADKMSPEQLKTENENISRKYDELVAFSVNLTAERDILNNTLEQTKRDLNREMATRTALEKQGLKVGSRSQDAKSGKGGGGYSGKMVLMVVVLAVLSAVRMTNSGALDGLSSVPGLGGILGFDAASSSSSSAKSRGRDEL